MNSQVAELWSDYRESRSVAIRNQLVEEYIKLVYIELSKAKTPKGFERDDIIQWGTIGLINAIEKCDLDQIDKFESYASIRIRGEIMDSLRNYIKSTQGISRNTLTRIREVEKARREISEQTNDKVSNSEIMTHLQLNEHEYSKLQLKTMVYSGVSMDDYLESPNDNPENIEKRFLLDETNQEIVDSLPLLKPKEEIVIRRHYFKNDSLNSIATDLNVSVARISQIHHEAIRHLRIILNQDKEGY